jgi:hypothetical protein
VGGPLDNSETGAAWVYTRSNGVWNQHRSKLVGTGAVGLVRQGWSLGLSADGNTAIVGGPLDNGGPGAAWVFIKPTTEDCKNGGWLNFIPSLPFTNQGQCVSYFAISRDSNKSDARPRPTDLGARQPAFSEPAP